MEIDPFVKAFVDSTFKQMQKYVRTREEVAPQVFLFGREKDGGSAIIPLIGVSEFFRSKEEKYKLRPLVKKVWQEMSSSKPWLKLMAVVVLSDAWAGEISLEEWDKMGRDVNRALGPEPGRAEALMIMVSLCDGDVWYQWPYIRGKGDVVFTMEPRVFESKNGEAKGVLMGLWPL